MLKQIPVVAVLTLAAATLLTTGCAKQEFQKQQVTAAAASVGFRQLPAKVDILIVPDDSASISVAWNDVNAQVASFAANLQGQYWDYHVARSLMSKTTPISQVLVHPEFNSAYLKDGTYIGTDGLVPSSRAITSPSSFQIMGTSYSSAGAGNDSTYANAYTVMNAAKQDTYTNFIRPDALLAVIVLTNGREGSVDATSLFGEVDADKVSVLQNHAANWLSIKNGNDSLLRYYPVAAYSYREGTASNYCISPGSPSIHGGSYFAMLNYLLGTGFNFCERSAIQRVMSDISAQLKIIKQAYVYSAIVLDEEPVESTLVITKNGQALPKDPVNGWQYRGLSTAATITGVADESTCPTQNLNDASCVVTPLSPGINRRTGYIIELNGSARMLGRDTPGASYEAR